MTEWHDLKDKLPREGQHVAVLCKNKELDSQFWFGDFAYYCDGEFYILKYDPHLGVLRKEHYFGDVDMWAEPSLPAYPD